jgi:lipopolysaccharide biosynthesis protein
MDRRTLLTLLKPVQRLMRRVQRIQDGILFLLGQLLRPFNFVRRIWPGADPLPNSKLGAVYAHYDREGMIHDYVIHQLSELAANGFRIVFVSNARKLQPESLAQIAPYCCKILWRFNAGYDFGAYKDGLNAIEGKSELTALLLMNDSVYGPFTKLRDHLAGIDRASTDFWGFTDSWEDRFHIQSYFVLFFASALQSEAFTKFWRRFPYVNHKGWVIRNGEIKLSQVLTRRKLRANVLAPYWSVSRKVLGQLNTVDTANLIEPHRSYTRKLADNLVSGRPVNPMHYFWETLIVEYKCPFLKRELVKSNPAQVPFAWQWPEVVQRAGEYDISMIRRHLQA